MRQIMRAGLLVFLTCTLVAGCDRGTLSDQIGRPAPVFSINDGQHAVDLQSLQGKVIVLNFWASWCAPCVEEMPSLQAFQQQMPQVQVVAISSNEAFAKYQHYVAQQHLTLLTVFDENQTSNKLYGSFKFPETYVIDKRGVIRRKLIGPQDFTSPSFLKYIQKLNS
jgi:cytochrome c biogenesis protein CcmG, thiol:disulfide interchange protein DsbE